ncbi:unnamed protein product [Thlaspi arvense]|uniref:Arf-GAP domain-containing protein n=1 Tax=Thlaspi arvense TaxID=13288 RepID=A0AAU9T3Q6_THLAR|nr:unnamed protein product [Thlaspi arvense]
MALLIDRIKEDERIEKAIRSLLKLPGNRRCINCNSLGPQYVCSTFRTFVCINCSGIHREFTHRVKSISMATFTAEEVSALRAGGNERARQIYFKEWDSQRDAYPDGSNIVKLRVFIRSVYVDKKYSSGSNDKTSELKPAVIEDYRESKKGSSSFFGSRSLHSLDKPEIDRASSGGRSGNESLKFYFDDKKHKQQQHVAHNPKSRGLPKSPIRFEIVDDRFRDDGGVKRYETRRELRGSSKSLDLSSNKDTPSFPIVRHASELGNVVKAEKKKDPMTASSDKMENIGSLIDDVPVVDKVSQNSNELPASLKKTEDPAPNSLEALLFGFSVPSVVDDPGTNNSLENYLGTQEMPRTPDSATTFVTSPTVAQPGSSVPAFSVSDDTLYTEDMANNQWESSTSPMEQSTLDISNAANGDGSEHHQDETTSSVRTALPEDLFTGGFSFASPQVHSQHHGMGYGMQYYQYPMSTGAFTYTAKPSNPFDLSCDDTVPNQTSQFPSMGYVQGGGLPHVSAPTGFSDSSSPVADSSIVLMASQSPFYATALSPTSPSLASNISPGAYMGQQSHVNMSPSFRQEMNGLGTAENTFNAYHHQANSGYPSANPNAYISRGNPFE